MSQRKIGGIGNHYGCLEIKEEDGDYYWAIEDYSGTSWEQIPAYLFDALNQFEDERGS